MAEHEIPECGEHQGTCARCGVEIKATPKRRRLKGEARRKRKTISLRVPDDTEDGGAIWDETLEETKSKLVHLGLYDEGDTIPNYEAVIAGLRDWLNTGTDGA